ncbi:MAG: PilZ domain-containing protein [Candidatus Xenobiia bacterium LiM19]
MAWLSYIKEKIMGSEIDEELFREKRSAPRVSCFLDANLTPDGEDAIEITIIALEMSGFRMITPVKLENGVRFNVNLRSICDLKLTKPFSTETVNGEVVWCRQRKGFPLYYAGARFSDALEKLQSSWITSVLDHLGVAPEEATQRRKSIRIVTSLPVKCYLGNRVILTGLANDLSLGGVKVNLIKNPGVGKEMKMQLGPFKRLPLLECQGRVRRSSYSSRREDFALGIEFLELREDQVKLLERYMMALLRESCM